MRYNHWFWHSVPITLLSKYSGKLHAWLWYKRFGRK